MANFNVGSFGSLVGYQITVLLILSRQRKWGHGDFLSLLFLDKLHRVLTVAKSLSEVFIIDCVRLQSRLFFN